MKIAVLFLIFTLIIKGSFSALASDSFQIIGTDFGIDEYSGNRHRINNIMVKDSRGKMLPLAYSRQIGPEDICMELGFSNKPAEMTTYRPRKSYFVDLAKRDIKPKRLRNVGAYFEVNCIPNR